VGQANTVFKKGLLALILLLSGLLSFFSCSPSEPPKVTFYTYEVVNSYPHDPEAFTQGLVFDEGILYESTGLYGRSTLRQVDLTTGKILYLHRLPPQFFGEGITIYQDKIIQLTWQSRVGFVYDKNSLALVKEFNYATEGWGITHDGKRLILSDGTSTLYFLHPETFAEIGRIEVNDNGRPVSGLNELEYTKGKIYANVWKTDRIALISPQTGQVIGWLDLSGLVAKEKSAAPVDVLNGIAYDAKKDRLLVTGKLWCRIYEIRLVAQK